MCRFDLNPKATQMSFPSLAPAFSVSKVCPSSLPRALVNAKLVVVFPMPAGTNPEWLKSWKVFDIAQQDIKAVEIALSPAFETNRSWLIECWAPGGWP